MKKINFTHVIIVAAILLFAIFSNLDVSAQSCRKTKNVKCGKQKEQTLASINAEILTLETELANIELVAKQNNINLGKPYDYTVLDKTAIVAVVEEKTTARK